METVKLRLSLERVPSKRPSITTGVSHCGLAIYIEKYLKAKEEL
jgi:hypothetical protein